MAPARVAVADRGHHADANSSSGGTLEEAEREHQGKVWDHDRDDCRDTVGKQTFENDDATSKPVRYRAEDQLRHAKAEKEGGKHQRAVVGIGDPERIADLGEGRKHDIDGEHVDRHECRHQRHEFLL